MEIGDIYMYIYIYSTSDLTLVARALCNMGGVKCLPFLEHSNHWKRALKMIFKGTGASSFQKLSLLLQRKKAYALPNVVHYKFSLFYRSRNC